MSAEKPEKVSIETNDAFSKLEEDFDSVLESLGDDKNLDRFKEEYQKLHSALKRSHSSEKKLIDKCRELNNEIVANASKVQAALRLSRQDQASIQILKKEIDKAWKLVDSAKSKEKLSRETINRLREEVQNLSKLVDQGAGLNIGQEEALNDLSKAKDDLTVEVQNLTTKLAEKTRQHNDLIEQSSDSRRKRKELESTIVKLNDANGKSKREIHNMNQRLISFQKNMQSMSQNRAQLMKTVEEKSNDFNEMVNEKKNLQAAFVDLDAQKQSVESEFRRGEVKIQDLYLTIEKMKQREASLSDKYNEAQKEIGKKKKEIQTLNFDLQRNKNKLEKMTDLKEKTLRNQQMAENVRDKIVTEMKTLRKEVMNQKKNADTDEKMVKELQNQIKSLTSQLVTSDGRTKEQQSILQAHEAGKKKMADEIQKHKKEEQKLRQGNYDLEKENDKVLGKSASWHAKYLEAGEVIRAREGDILDMKKLIEEEEKKLKLQKSLYEQVRADRNFFSKKHIQSQDEIAEMKQKFKIMTHQIKQLKEEIHLKDNALINEHFSYKKLSDEMKVKHRRLNKKNEVLETADKVLANQNDEIQNLRRTLEGAQYEQQQQKKIYDDVVQERDILAAQLIRRNDELALLYEKIRIQQSTLSKGETQYRERVKDIQMMKLQLASMKREINIRNHEVENTESLKNELYNVQRELLQEKTKVRALSEELENPMNVHRWRQLEGSDPKRWELIQKIQTLQKRLIVKTEEAVEKDMLLQEKEKLYVELKNILARQPGPEVAEQLSVYQQSLKEKTRQMKAMAAELNMHQAQISEYRYEIERLSRELQDSKKKFYEQKRRDQIQKEILRESQQNDPLIAQQQRFHNTQSKIAGGGFNLQSRPVHS